MPKIRAYISGAQCKPVQTTGPTGAYKYITYNVCVQMMMDVNGIGPDAELLTTIMCSHTMSV